MGLSNSVTTNSNYYSHPSWYDGRYHELGNVQIRSVRVKSALGLAVHHLVRFEPFSGS